MNNINQKTIMIGAIVLIIMLVVIIAYISTQRQEYTNYEQLEISDTDTATEILQEETEESIIKIKVHVAGSVVTEGIVELEEGARIADAIQSAGGTTADANMQKINLAYKLQDGQKIYIPNLNEDETAIIENGGIVEDTSSTTSTSANNTGKININTAKQTELELITGIGPSTATKIIEYREENGNFQTIEDVKNVPGIGEAKYESMKEEITI